MTVPTKMHVWIPWEIYYNTLTDKYLPIGQGEDLALSSHPIDDHQHYHLHELPKKCQEKLALLRLLSPEKSSDKFVGIEGVGRARWSLLLNRYHYIFYQLENRR